MIPRPDLCDARTPGGVEVFQLTNDPALPSCHLYMEAQVFTPDSRRFLLHRSAHAHDSDRTDPRHRYQVCDLENDGALTDLTTEVGATAPSVTPDGATVYYFIDESTPGVGRVTLKRVKLDGSARETVLVIDSPLPGTHFRPSQLYPLSTISSDGNRLALSCFLGDGVSEGAPWGLLVFDLPRAEVRLVVAGPTWCNMHPQYCRSRDADAAHDILIQENHGSYCSATGEILTLVSGAGADIHVIRDDGMHFRNLPWGRNGEEYCQGHQCWLGSSQRAITSTWVSSTRECQLIAGDAAPFLDHHGIATPESTRIELSRHFPNPQFYHFATDSAGARLITDSGQNDNGGSLYLAALPAGAETPIAEFTYLLSPRASWQPNCHIHPFLSPDGRKGFFNSDESGTLQAYMVRLP